MSDPVTRPPHYTFGKHEPIDVIEDWQLNFRLGNAVKYIARAGRKGDRLEDLRKAEFYLRREIENGSHGAAQNGAAPKPVQGTGAAPLSGEWRRRAAWLREQVNGMAVTARMYRAFWDRAYWLERYADEYDKEHGKSHV